jgi:hypothetical protein
MAIIKKTLSAENLDKFAVLVNDIDVNSKYFKVTELPDTFTGGKNAFLIQGSEYLVADTLIKIEIKDAQGNIIYHEPGEGIISASVGSESIVTEYYEGVSKVVAVYIYPNRTLDTSGNYSDGTAYGPATITILGELSTYDNNGTNVNVPTNWEGKYNVKWQKTVNVNPALANTTKVRFYKRPTATIFETLSPIYTFDTTGSKVASNVTQSFANIKVLQLDTFAGDVKRIKVYRTSQGDISDYDLIQDILVESKELLSTTALSGSVVGTAGFFTSEVVKKLWNTGSLNTLLTSSRVDNGLRLNGSGKFRYTSSLNLSDVSVYEFGIDAFYSASTSGDLQIYLSGSNNGELLVGTLNGISPTKNLKDTIIQFSLPKAEPTASLYLSQSQGEWHIGNLTLQLTQDTAFSPSEISFVTSMPTVIGNETYNFKFEFYDVNNNYVPVAVTQSAQFTGGNNNIGGTLTFISSSASQSLADLNRVSSSISGTIVVTSGSISGSITSVSSSVSGTITTLSGSVSGTIGNVSSSVSGTINVLSGSVSGSIYTLSGSVSTSVRDAKAEAFANVQRLANGDFPGTFIDSSSIYSPVIGGQLGYFSTLFKVGTSPSIYLDARQNPRKIFIGGTIPAGQTEYSGSYNNTNTNVYLDSTGKFSLGNKLNWNGVDTLTVNGTINASAGTFSGNITSTATISGGTISGGTISGGSIAIGSGDNIFKASTDGISLGSASFANAPFRVTAAGALTATSATINGAITATSLTLIPGVTVPNTSVSGLGSLATKSSVSATTDVTGLGALATRNSVNATYIDDNSITTGKILANQIVAEKIASLKFFGRDAQFDTGSIAGWTIDGTNGLQKISGNYILKLNSNAQKIAITKTNPIDSLDVVVLDASETIPQIVASDTGTINYPNNNEVVATVDTSTPYNSYNTGWELGNGGSNSYGTGYFGIIGLQYANEEIGIDPAEFPSIANVIQDNVYDGNTYSEYECILRVRKFPTSTDAINQTNADATFGDKQVVVAEAKLGKNNNNIWIDVSNVYGGTIEAAGGGGINTPGVANWYRVEIFQNWSGQSDSQTEFDSIYLRRPASNIVVRFGRVANGFSVLSPGGLQVYQGFRNYMNVSSPSGSTGVASNFCLIKGKSEIIGSLNVTSGFSAANKQFKITHPLNKNKWLYHTSIEAPRADLIYRGHIQLENGSGSCLIDSVSRMSDGTFESLTKNSQLFLQNENGFDKVRGNVISGSISVISENINSNDVISWMVVAERKDEDILNSPLYDSNGNYKPERYTSEYSRILVEENLAKMESGSI